MPLRGPFRKIYVRAPNWVGDLVAASAAFREISAAYPEAELSIGVREHLAPILRGAPWAQSILSAEGRSRGLRETARALKEKNFDLAILLTNSFRSAVPAFLAGIPHRIGYAGQGRGFLLTRRLKPPREGMRRIPVPMIYSYSNLLGIIGVTPRSIRPELFFRDEDRNEAVSHLELRGIRPGEKFAVISPGASYGSSKLWQPDRFAAVVDGLWERNRMKSFVHVGPGEEKIGQEIAQHAKHKPANSFESRRDLHQLKPIVSMSSLMICTDSGPRHYAVAFDKPIVCLMGPTHPMFTHANVEKTELVRVEVDCGPCQLKTCPLDHRCMDRIDVEMVLSAVGRSLSREM